jgi:DNA/RNA-binding domain of Phe-tRNA-synthetase-like protein
MQFRHAETLRADHPELACGVIHADGITPAADPGPAIARFEAIAAARLAQASEGEFPEIQAWRRVFSRMGLKPTQYRCAAEALLRRFRQDGALPRLHPLIDLCNAASLAHAVPIAVFDLAGITGNLEVRQALGTETYTAFSGETEYPAPGEVIFADDAGEAHARRWCHRQGARSGVRESTASVLIVAEAMHGGAAHDIAALIAALGHEIAALWPAEGRSAQLTAAAPTFAV